MSLPQPTALIPRAAPDDAELVRRARGGDEWAFDALYRRHVQFVAAVALRLGRGRADVDDVVQETFVLALTRLDTLADDGAFRGWLARIAVSRVHRRLRWARFVSLFKTGEEQEQSLDAMASSAASPDVVLQLKSIDAKVRTLPLPLRTAWTLRFVLGCTLEEVAAGCDCSLATAKRRLADAVSASGVTLELEEEVRS